MAVGVWWETRGMVQRTREGISVFVLWVGQNTARALYACRAVRLRGILNVNLGRQMQGM